MAHKFFRKVPSDIVTLLGLDRGVVKIVSADLNEIPTPYKYSARAAMGPPLRNPRAYAPRWLVYRTGPYLPLTLAHCHTKNIHSHGPGWP